MRRLSVVVLLAVIVSAWLALPASAVGVGIGGMYFPGASKTSVSVDVEQQWGSCKGAAFTADALLLDGGDVAAGVAVKGKSGPMKWGAGYAFGKNAPDFNYKNIGATVVYQAYATPVTPSALSLGEQPAKELTVGLLNYSARSGPTLGAQYSLRFK